jgi:hypothetical protein
MSSGAFIAILPYSYICITVLTNHFEPERSAVDEFALYTPARRRHKAYRIFSPYSTVKLKKYLIAYAYPALRDCFCGRSGEEDAHLASVIPKTKVRICEE